MEIKTLQLGFFGVNCYILQFDAKCIIIDPGADGQKIIEYLESKRINPLMVVNTHGHYDHIGAVPEVAGQYEIPFYIHPLEKDTVTNPEINMSAAFGGSLFSISAYQLIDQNTKSRLSDLGLEIFHTPGHSPGSVTIKAGAYLFCGDLLFQGAVGRTDLPGGNLAEIKKSLRKIRKMDKNLNLYPGHGQQTVLGHELDANYYLSDDFLGKDQ